MKQRPAVGLRLGHVALWTRDLERARRFYEDVLGGSAGPKYRNPNTGLESYFVSFAGDVRLELMTRPDVTGVTGREPRSGFAHVALASGSREAVDALIADLRRRGVPVTGEPRTTGDGFYEAVIADPDGNAVEIIA